MSEATGTQLMRHSQELTIFHDVAKALTSSLDLDSILQTIMDKMAEYFRPDTWSLLMVDEEHGDLYFAIAVGDKAETLKNIRLKVGEGIAGWVAKHGEQLVIPDVEADSRFAKRVDEATKMETHSIICIQRAGNFLPAIAVRLCRHCHRKCALGRTHSGTHHHRRLHRPLQRAPSL
jgi:transcriptional regulator with GAF, ATPase, and Fis domain